MRHALCSDLTLVQLLHAPWSNREGDVSAELPHNNNKQTINQTWQHTLRRNNLAFLHSWVTLALRATEIAVLRLYTKVCIRKCWHLHHLSIQHHIFGRLNLVCKRWTLKRCSIELVFRLGVVPPSDEKNNHPSLDTSCGDAFILTNIDLVPVSCCFSESIHYITWD